MSVQCMVLIVILNCSIVEPLLQSALCTSPTRLDLFSTTTFASAAFLSVLACSGYSAVRYGRPNYDTSIHVVDTYVTRPASPRSRYTAVKSIARRCNIASIDDIVQLVQIGNDCMHCTLQPAMLKPISGIPS